MADLNYLLSPAYGFEPFASNGGAGGANVTGHNLVITTWALDDKLIVSPILVFGALRQPISQNDNISVQKRVAGGQAMHSRNSAQMFFEADPNDDPPDSNFLFVLNPPPELRQQIAGSVVFNGGDPLDLANYTVKQSLQGCYVWDTEVDLAPASDQNFYLRPQTHVAMAGSYLNLGDYNGIGGTPIPLLKTSGADGQTPQFFDRTTAQGVNEMIAAINAGNFYIPLLVFLGGPGPTRVTIKWPHSVARG